MGFKKVPFYKTLPFYLLFTLCFHPDFAKAKGTCKIGEFRCESGECIPRDKVCDSVRDCPSGIDEYVCTPKFRRGLCGYHRMRYRAQDGLGDLAQNVISLFQGKSNPRNRPGIFQCQFGGCITLNRLCDGNVNCIGGSDESEICENNSCLPGQFRCKYGACIPDWQMCNGRINCPDGSDETPEACRHVACKPNEFRCRYGGCIPKDRICDIKKHCADGSDEYDFLCLITRAKMVEQWGQETKLINAEQEQRFLELAEKERRRAATTSKPTTTTTESTTVSESTTTSASTTVKEEEKIVVGVANTSSSKEVENDEEDIVPSPVAPVECVLPKIPENSDASIPSCSNHKTARFCKDPTINKVPVGVIIQYECGAGFLLYGPQAITCQADGSWTARPPECDPLIDVRFGFGSALPNNFDPKCPALIPVKGVRVECIDPENVQVKPCGEKQTPGTEARFTCAPYFRPSTDLPTHYEKCGEDGTWGPGAHSQFSCVPDCGLSEVPKTPLIKNGVATKRGQWPWHVALFFRKGKELEYICGGALITENAVLTSAHCVTHRGTGATKDPGDYVVYLGKQNRALPDPDPFVQRRSIEKIFVEESFNPRALDSDLALLSLSAPAVLSYYVRPVCYPQASNSFLEEYQLAPGSLGTVVGFGFTENGTLSQNLRMTQLPVVSSQDCADTHDTDFFASMTRSTNYCAGYRNGTQVCNGDSGGGMYFKAMIKGTTRWFLQGLVSYGVPGESKKGTCESNHYAIFTRVGRYGDWIVRTLSREGLN